MKSNRPDWVLEHLRRYVETDGEDGHIWNDVPTLLLTTYGRKSGQTHTTPLIYGRDGDQYLVVASKGRHDLHPDWYLNLTAQPEVGVQVAAERFSARARTAEPTEKQRLWGIMAQIWPAYNDYQSKTTRDIPVVILEPL